MATFSLIQSRLDQELRSYREQLDKLIVCPCPFCDHLLIRSFDRSSFGGPWWLDRKPSGPEPCPHFCVVRLAVHPQELPLGNGPPTGRVFLGPQLPHLVPRLLELPTVVAVLSQARMRSGHIVYLIAYFATERPPVSGLLAPCYADNYEYVDDRGARGTRPDDDKIDFDINPWIASGKVLWCVPGGDNRTLAPNTEPCPYLDVVGDHEPQSLTYRRPLEAYVDAHKDDLATWYDPRKGQNSVVRTLCGSGLESAVERRLRWLEDQAQTDHASCASTSK